MSTYLTDIPKIYEKLYHFQYSPYIRWSIRKKRGLIRAEVVLARKIAGQIFASRETTTLSSIFAESPRAQKNATNIYVEGWKGRRHLAGGTSVGYVHSYNAAEGQQVGSVYHYARPARESKGLSRIWSSTTDGWSFGNGSIVDVNISRFRYWSCWFIFFFVKYVFSCGWFELCVLMIVIVWEA